MESPLTFSPIPPSHDHNKNTDNIIDQAQNDCDDNNNSNNNDVI